MSAMIAVHRAAAFLSGQKPDWFQLVDTATLNMQDERKCVLGQLYGHYGYGLEAFSHPALKGSGEIHFEAFTLPPNSPPELWAELTQQWIEVIELYRTMRAAPPLERGIAPIKMDAELECAIA